MRFLQGPSHLFKDCTHFWIAPHFRCPWTDTNNLTRIMRKITKCSLHAPIWWVCCKTRDDFFFFHQNFKKMHPLFFFLLFARSHSLSHTHHSNPLTSIQTNYWCREDEKARQTQEEREKGRCLVFIIHPLVACSVTLFSLSSPLPHFIRADGT